MNFEGRRGAARTCVGAVVLFFTRVAFGYFTAVAPWPSLVPRGPSPKSPIAQIERRAPRFFSPRERRSGPPRRGSTCLDARRAGRPGLASARRGRRRSPRVRERGAGCVLPRRARPNSGRPSRGGAAARVLVRESRSNTISIRARGQWTSINPPGLVPGTTGGHRETPARFTGRVPSKEPCLACRGVTTPSARARDRQRAPSFAHAVRRPRTRSRASARAHPRATPAPVPGGSIPRGAV